MFHPECRFTDDTVLTVAIADAIVSGQPYLHAVRTILDAIRMRVTGFLLSLDSLTGLATIQQLGKWFGHAGQPSRVRVFERSCILRQARLTAEITYNHPEGIKGAEATALAVFLARTTRDKALIRNRIVRLFGYDLNRTLDSIRLTYSFDVSCQGRVPEAIVAFLESDSYEDAIRNAISLGGDSDTLACITGGIAEAFYGGVPAAITGNVKQILASDLWEITDQFRAKYL